MDESSLESTIAIASMRDQMREALDKSDFEQPVLLITVEKDGTIVSHSAGFGNLTQVIGMLELVKLQQISAWESDD